MKRTPKGLIDPQDGHFYYLHQDDGQMFGVVFVGKTDDGKYCRGISLCNLEADQFDKNRGRVIAYRRFRSAVGSKKSSMPYTKTHDPVLNMLYDCDRCLEFEKQGYKSAYDIVLTKFEYRIFTRPV